MSVGRVVGVLLSAASAAVNTGLFAADPSRWWTAAIAVFCALVSIAIGAAPSWGG